MMADDPAWPLPKFRFVVEWDGFRAEFQEVSGLDSETQVIEYRAGDSKAFSTVKMPGMAKFGNIVMKRGVFANENTVWDWISQIKMNTITRKPLTIRLLDETGAPTMVWSVANAFPVKLSGTDLKEDGNVIAVESIEFAHEGLTIQNA